MLIGPTDFLPIVVGEGVGEQVAVERGGIAGDGDKFRGYGGRFDRDCAGGLVHVHEDGKFIVKDFRTDEEIEEARIQNIKLTAQSLILSKYSLEKQSSAQLGLYGEMYLQEMKDYISNIIRISNEAELNGTKVEDIQWL